MSTADSRYKGLRGVLSAFGTPAAGTLLCLGFGSGLPFLLVGYTLSIWLREGGLQLGTIGLLSYIGMFYVFKFFWAPLIDRWDAPLVGGLGRRRGWLVLSILVLAMSLLGMAISGPTQLGGLILATILVAFAGATQDIVVDAYRIEIAPVEAQGALAATYTLGYRFGYILSGAGALYIAAFSSWRLAYFCMAGAMLLPLAATLLAREPAGAQAIERKSFYQAFVGPFRDFFQRHGVKLALVLLVFVGLYKLPDQMLGVIAGPFYVDTGYSKAEIATVSKLYGVWIGIGGAFLGGFSVAILGLRRSLLIGGLGLALSNLLYLLMALNPGETWAFVAAISGDNGALGFAGVVLIAFLSGLTSREYTATQYALLVSLANLPGKVIGGVSGFLVENLGWGYSGFFVFSCLSIVPTLLMLVWLWRYIDPPAESHS